MKHPPFLRASSRRDQSGAVVIVLGVMLALLIGFAGLAIDLGRFFVVKTELQNAVDACALSAASQLRPGQGNPAALTNAVAYGRVFSSGGTVNIEAIKNRANFQSAVVAIAPEQITFSDTLNGSYEVSTVANPDTARYVKCTYPLSGLPIYFMRVLNPALSTQVVSAMAAATLDSSQSSCAIPIGVCKAPGSTEASNFGLTLGQWMVVKSGSTPYGTGNFGWIDFTPPGGGASELADLLTGSGQCELKTGDLVGQSGSIASLNKAWNTRFGLYTGSDSVATASPDKTGYGYSKDNWQQPAVGSPPVVPPPSNAYSGTSTVAGAVNYQAATNGNLAYQGDIPAGINLNGYKTSSSAEYVEFGKKNRRVAVAPVVDCTVWNTGSAQPPVEGWACVLMLHPIDNTNIPELEFLGLSTTPGTPCATSGLAGTGGPLVPILVQ